MKILISLMILCTWSVSAKEYSSKTLFKYYKDAVVRIDVLQQGIQVSHGTGFFIDEHGTIATNFHVAKDGLFVSGNSIKITTHDKVMFKDYKVGKCMDDRKIDLCILKVEFQPKRWVQLHDKKFDIGEKTYSIGHPRGLDWTMTEGILSSYREMPSTFSRDPKKLIEQVQISTPVSPGNSGGPLFSSSGKLVGVTTWGRVDRGSQNLNFAITVGELKKFYESISKYSTVSEMYTERRNSMRKYSARIKTELIDPIYEKLKENEKAGKWVTGLPKDFGVVTFNGFNYQYMIPLLYTSPKKCEVITDKETLRRYQCKVSNDHAYRVEIYKNKKKIDIMKRWNKKSMKPVPLPLLSSIQKSPDWKTIKANLSEKNLKYLHFFQSKDYKCRRYGASKLYSPIPKTDCMATFYNFEKRNHVAVETMMQYEKDGEFISVYGISTDGWDVEPVNSGVSLGTLLMKRIDPKKKAKQVNRAPASVAQAPQANTIGTLVANQARQKPSIDLDSLRYKCTIKGQANYCKTLASYLGNKTQLSREDVNDMFTASSLVCDETNDAKWCFYAGAFGSRVRSPKSVNYYIKSCKGGYKDACNVKLGK